MSDAYFQTTGDSFVPEPRARGPWSEDMMHGRLLGGLAARVIERDFVPADWRVGRLTVDLFRPAAMAPVTVETAVVRQGRKLQIVDALLHCDGHAVGRVTALLLTTGPEPPGTIWRPGHTPWPDPRTLPAPTDGTGDAESEDWLFRTVQGGFGSAIQTRVWTNDTLDLVDGERTSPLVRAAVSGDIACPLANSSDEGLHYINADYTMLLGRYPVGDWIGVEVAQQLQADGVSMAMGTMVDEQGPFGTSGGSSIVRPPMMHD